MEKKPHRLFKMRQNMETRTMNPEHTQDINGAFPAHAALAAQIKRHPSGYNATLYDTGYKGDLKDCESVYYKDLLAEFTALKQAAEGMAGQLKNTLNHILEFEDAWKRGSITAHDRLGGLRANRNVEIRHRRRGLFCR